MSETTTAPAPEAPATSSLDNVQTTSTQADTITWDNSPIAQIYNPDGTLKDGAGDAFKEQGLEDISGFATRNNQGFFESLKQGKEAQAFASRKQEAIEGAIVKPGEGATDDDINAFKASLGALSDPDAYEKALYPETLPEGFVKDEGMAKVVSNWAAKHPVNTPEAMRELAEGFSAHMEATGKELQESQAEEFENHKKETFETIKTELGGPEAMEGFIKGAKQYLSSDSVNSLGFEFKTNEDGVISSENPLHDALLSDPAFLRLVNANMKEANPATIPADKPLPSTVDDAVKERQEIMARNPNGWQSTDDFKRYQEIKNIR